MSDSWDNPVSGDWSDAADWSTGALPGSGSSVTIGVAGTYTVTLDTAAALASLALSDGDATFDVENQLTVSGTISLTAGTLDLESGGTIAGGTLQLASGAAVDFDGGTLSGVTYQGALDLSAASSALTVTDGITLENTTGTEPGTIDLTGAFANLYIAGTTTLDNATLDIGTSSNIDTLTSQENGSAAVLTLGDNLDLVAGVDAILTDGGNTGDGIVNDGTISFAVSDPSGSAVDVLGNSFSNGGTITVSDGDNFDVESANFANTGNISVAAGGTLTLYQAVASTADNNVSNSGTISFAVGAALDIEGETLTTAQLLAIDTGNATLDLSFSTVDNSGATLDVGTGTSLGTVVPGTIIGGTIVDAGDGFTWDPGAVLSGVTYRGTLDLSGGATDGDGANLTITGGITLQNQVGTLDGLVDLTGYTYSDAFSEYVGNEIAVEGSTTLNNATINIGNADYGDYLESTQDGTTPAVLTLGSGLTIIQTGTASLEDAGESGDGIVNDGLISAAVADSQFTITGNSFTNNGTVAVSNDDELTIYSLGGITNSGIFSIGAGSTLVLSADTITHDGTIDFTGSDGTLKIVDTAMPGDTIYGFAPGDGIDLAGIAYDPTGSATLLAGNVLQISENGDTYDLQLNPSQSFSGTNFQLAQDGSGTLVTVPPVADAWAEAVSGDWSDAADWSTGAVPSSNSDVTIGVSGTYTVTLDTAAAIASLTLSDSDATFGVENQLTVSGTTSLTAGTLYLVSGGIISGGTLQPASGGNVDFGGGTLSGVTYEGTLNVTSLDGGGGDLTITDGITLENATGTGPGTLSLISGSNVYVDGTTTLNDATISVDSEYGTSFDSEEDGGPAVLTFGSGLTFAIYPTNVVTIQDGGGADDGIVNDGTIEVGGSGEAKISGNSFTNNGSIIVGEGNGISVADTNFTNSGTISIGADAGFNLSAAGSADDGTISFTGADGGLGIGTDTTNLGDIIYGFAPGDEIQLSTIYDPTGAPVLEAGNVLQFTNSGVTYDLKLDPSQDFTGENFYISTQYQQAFVTVAVPEAVSWEYPDSATWRDGSWNNTSSAPDYADAVTIAVAGTYTVTIADPATAASLTLSNRDATLDVNEQLFVGGTIDVTAGTIKVQGDAVIYATTIVAGGGTWDYDNGSFSGVTYQGTLDMSAYGSLLYIVDGITLESATGTEPGTIDLTGDQSRLFIDGTTTLNNATINFGASGGQNSYLESEEFGSSATLTFGSGLAIDLQGSAVLEAAAGTDDGIVNDGSIDVASDYLGISGNSFTNSGSMTLGADGELVVDSSNFANTSSGTITIGAGATVTLSDAVSAEDDGTINFAGTGGAIEIADAFTVASAVTGTGTLQIGENASLEIDSSASVAGTVAIDFNGADGTLLIGGTTMPPSTIDGFTFGDSIDLAGIAYDPTGSAALLSGNVLQVSENGDTYDLELDPTQDYYPTEYFQLGDLNGGTGTEITLEGTPCYCRGTLILTDRGEIPVEELIIGDLLIAVSGQNKPLRWIGRRSYAGRFAWGNRDVLPVLIKSGALADNVPKRDLWVSPLHAMFLDGVLIPALALVNGNSIVQAEAVDQVEYFHLELAEHDLIWAEGAASETFIDDDSRGMFLNAAEYRVLYPDAPHQPARYCAPRVEDGDALETVRRKIAARIGAAKPAPIGPLRGVLELVRPDLIEGWAQNELSPHAPVVLRILDNGAAIAELTADRYRADLEQAGIGDGHHSFSFTVPGGLSPEARHVIQAVRAEDGRELTNSPRRLEPTVAARPAPLEPAASTPAAREGRLELVSRDLIEGWAWDRHNPDQPMALLILNHGEVVARVLANRHRPDLATAGIGDGRHAFQMRIPGGLSPLSRHEIQVCFEADGSDLPGSPVAIEASTSFDATLEQTVANSVAALGTVEEQERALAFLAAQTEQLLRLRAQTEGGYEARLAYAQFRRRWGADLPADVEDPGLRALVVDEVAPLAGRDGGSQAVLSHMGALQGLGYRVSFASATDIGAEAMAGLEAAGITVCAAPFYTSVEDVLRRQAGCFDVVYLHRAAVATNYLALARQYCPKARILYSVADLHHVRLARQAEIDERPELLAASRRMKMQECTAAWSADAVITHSTEEAALLRRAVPAANVHVVPWEVPMRPAQVPFAQRSGIAFIGSYGHAPNLDAARFLAEQVMPLVWREDRGIECLLVGSGMPDRIRQLARPGLSAVGHVADLAEIFDRVRLTVAPMRYGAGVKGKVLESFAAGVPCVMSPIAAEGIDFPATLAAYIGAGAEELAARIVALHTDATAHAAAAAAGLGLIGEAFGAQQVTAALQVAIDGRVLNIRPETQVAG